MNPEVHFDPGSHVYTVDNIRRPSVTGILDAEKFFDFSRIPGDPTEYLKRGSYIHAACEQFDEDRMVWDEVREDYHGYIHAWANFQLEIGFDNIEIERPVFHPWHGYAGTPDRIGKIRGVWTLADIKTGVVAPWTGIQTAGYVDAWARTNDIDPESVDRIAIQLMKDGKYRTTRFKDHAGDVSTFLAAVTCYNWKRNNGIKI